MGKDVMVYKVEKGWALRTTGSSKALKIFDTQKQAEDYGIALARKNESELRIKGKDNKVRLSKTFRK